MTNITVFVVTSHTLQYL